MDAYDKIEQKALNIHVNSEEALALYQLLNQTLDYARQEQGMLALAHGREKKYREQIERQKQMITNLENALFGKKK